MQETNLATILTFVVYILGVFVLAIFSNRLLSKKSFMGEYFLGSRGLGSWALAFTFAATSSSGGSFTGFPSLIYTHGWILALWIGSYMVVPVCTMGVLGKRLNQVARKTNAITIPDVLRDRFEATGLGLFATCTIIFFTVSNLVAQFKAGAIILQKTFNLDQIWSSFSFPQSWDQIGSQSTTYIIALVVFAAIVIFYTAFGGFRAVVWTDVMQGVVMGIGIVILLPVIISIAGGLEQVNDKIRKEKPLVVSSLPGKNNDLVFLLHDPGDGSRLPVGVKFQIPKTPIATPSVQVLPEGKQDGDVWIWINVVADSSGKVQTTAEEIKNAVLNDPSTKKFFVDEDNKSDGVKYAFDNDGTGKWIPKKSGPTVRSWRFIHGDEFLFGPGRRADGTPFHTLGFVISFFFMWAISGMGQPGTMVRLMAFKESRTLKRAILTVTFYYAMIYLPLVFIFVAARTMLPSYIPQEDSDNSMVIVATRVVANKGLILAILAAVFVAAPFAAVMSTVDSFLLMVSSSLVRDVYQRTINPNVGEKAIKYGSYATTAVAGALVTIVAMNPPDFLQYIIVFTGGGFASTFLAPMFLGLYWKGMTKYGAYASMVGGFSIIIGCFAPQWMPQMNFELLGTAMSFGGQRLNPFGFHPIFWGLAGSFTLGIVTSLLTGPPPVHLVNKYFRVPVEK